MWKKRVAVAPLLRSATAGSSGAEKRVFKKRNEISGPFKRGLLTKQDLSISLMGFRVFAALSFCPYDWDQRTKRLRIRTRIWKKLLQWLHMLIWAIHTIGVSYRTWELMAGDSGNVAFYMGCPVACLSVSFICAYMYVCAAFLTPEFYIKAIHEIIDFVGVEERSAQKHWVRSLIFRSRQDLLMIFCCPVFIGVAAFHVLIFLTQPSAPNFVYFNVPEALKGFQMMILCALFEFYIVNLWLSVGFLAVFVPLGCFYMILESLKRCGDTVLSRIRTGRKVQLMIQEFNDVNCNIVFGVKITLIFVTIIFGFVAIHAFGSKPLLAGIFFVLFLIIVFAYNVTLENGFVVLLRMKKYKIETAGSVNGRARMGGCNNSLAWAVRMIRAIRPQGVRQGSYSYLERESPLLFADFCIGHIVDLLLTFRA